MTNTSLFYRYWWNTRILSFTKNHIFITQRYCFYLSRVRILVSPWLLAWLANYKRASRSGARPVLLKFHSQNGFEVRRRYSYRWLSRWAAKFSHRYFFRAWRTFRKICRSLGKWCWKTHWKRIKKKCCLLCRNFISISKINRSLHGRLGIQISFSRVESISHSKMKFVSPCGHVISSIFAMIDINRCFVRWDREIHIFNPCFRACPQNWTPLFH